MRIPSLAFWLVTPATLGLLAPNAIRAAGPPINLAPGAVHDVALGEGSSLTGLVVDVQGQPLAGVEVLAMPATGPTARAKTAADGRFLLASLPGGVYEVTSAGGGGIYRVWSRGSAPPSAAGSIHIVAGSHAVRGQSPRTGFLHSDAFLIGAAVLGAVAIPIVILAARRETPPAS